MPKIGNWPYYSKIINVILIRRYKRYEKSRIYYYWNSIDNLRQTHTQYDVGKKGFDLW